MRAHLAQLGLVHDQNRLGALHGREAVGDQNAGPAFDHAVECSADAQFRVGVHAGRGLVEDEDARVKGQGAGKVDQLLLAGGKRTAALLHRFVEAARQALDEVQRVHIKGGLAQVGVGDLLVAEADVSGDGSAEQERVLEDDGEVLAQREQIVLAQVDAVEQDLAGGHVVEAHHQAGEGGFPGAGVPHDGHRLAGFDDEGDVFENPFDAVDGGERGGRVRARIQPCRKLGIRITGL